jgi:hypothetical protein
MTTGKTMSWGWIIFWFIIFWPIGIFFLFRKLNRDKTATLKNSKTISIISYVLMGMGIIYLIMAFTNDSGIFIAALLFGGGGLWLNRVAKKMKKNGDKYKKYISLVINQSMTQIDNIASIVGVSYDVAKVDLQKMIDTGYFIGAFINEGSREIVLAKHAEATMFQPKEVKTLSRVVGCKSCGANNSVVIGQIKECEYCGSLVE